MKETIDSIVSIDGVLYPIHKKDGKYTMRYAGIEPQSGDNVETLPTRGGCHGSWRSIELHPADDIETLLAAFSHLPVKRYRSVQELKKWYDEMVKILPPT